MINYLEMGPGWLATEPPTNEKERMNAVLSCNILDTPPEEEFDRITRIAAKHFSVPTCVISIVGDERQWFKSRCGTELTETPRELAFCSHTIHEKDAMIVLDARTDFRFKGNPMVTGEPHVAFYVGAPLTSTTGEVYGALCLIDNVPHGGFSRKDVATLKMLAMHVATELDIRRLILLEQLQ